MDYQAQYDALYKKAYEENVNSIYQDAVSGGIESKITNFCALHNVAREELLENIRTNKIVRAFFAKNPNKQNIYEKIAGDFIRGMGAENFRQLSTSELYVTEGVIMAREELKAYMRTNPETKPCKTVDFTWDYEGLKFYAAHKYTKDEGGAQGNQYKDLQQFIEHSTF